jgi:hypothetical protein
MEKRLPSGYFFKNGMPTSENIRAWIYYFINGGFKDDTKINMDAFKEVQKIMEWESEKNGLLCFLWGLDKNAKNSKSTGDYAEMMIHAKNLAWDIYLHQEKRIGENSTKWYHKTNQMKSDLEVFKFAYKFNNRLVETGDIRFFYLKVNESGLIDLYFNYGKHNGKLVHDVMDEDMGYMLNVIGDKSDVSDWVKADLLESIIPRLRKKANNNRTKDLYTKRMEMLNGTEQ